MPLANGEHHSYVAHGTGKSREVSSESDSEFEDTNIETPVALRETSRSFGEGTYTRTTTTIPLKNDSTKHTNISTPTRTRKRKALVSFSDEERELIRTEKLISDNNEFSPHGEVGSPARRMRLTSLETLGSLQPPTSERQNFKRRSLDKDIEFDVSDRDLPEKGNKSVGNISKNSVRYDEYKQTVTKTPQRLSPLRKEIIPSSSSVKSAAEQVAEEIVTSGAIRLKTAKEIIAQINSSIDKMREKEGILVSDDSDSDEEILRQIDSFLPSRKDEATKLEAPMENVPKETISKENTSRVVTTPLGSPSRAGNYRSISSLLAFNERKEAEEKEKLNSLDMHSTSKTLHVLLSPKPISPKLATITGDEEPETHELNGEFENETETKPRSSKVSRKRASATNRKLSGKYARDVLRKRKLIEKPGKYESWLYDKWDKLKRLVELSIPNNVIINNPTVLKELGCKDKDELAQRIRFLSRKR